MDPFRAWISTLSNPLLFTVCLQKTDLYNTNLYVRYNSCALHPLKTVSSDPLQDEHTYYAPQHLQTELDTVYIISLQNGQSKARH